MAANPEAITPFSSAYSSSHCCKILVLCVGVLYLMNRYPISAIIEKFSSKQMRIWLPDTPPHGESARAPSKSSSCMQMQPITSGNGVLAYPVAGNSYDVIGFPIASKMVLESTIEVDTLDGRKPTSVSLPRRARLWSHLRRSIASIYFESSL